MEKLHPMFDTDSYKASHFLQYPPETTSMVSYLESRGGEYPVTVFFGLQYLLSEYLSKRVTQEDVERARTLFIEHGEPFPYEGWMYIARECNGYLPLRIRAVPEGSVVPTNNVLVTVESTDPNVFWLVSWVETLLMRVWYPTTVATRSWSIKQTLVRFLELTSDHPSDEIPFKLHDFGARGVSSQETAAIGGAAHLVNFLGTDTVAALLFAETFYGVKMAGFSIPAAEHSTITTWGPEHEVDAYRNMLRRFGKPGALVAVVSDSYDLNHAVEHLWGEALRDEVMESGATVVIRPDSGDPKKVVLETVQRLEAKFGSAPNRKGYKVLNRVRVIQGDGVTPHTIGEILQILYDHGYSTTNIAFGMGGALLQQVNRDTLKFAYKCSEITRSGQRIPVCKSPATDLGKRSKAGYLDLILENNVYRTVSTDAGEKSALREVFRDGRVLVKQTLSEIRARANKSLDSSRVGIPNIQSRTFGGVSASAESPTREYPPT